MEKLRGTRPGNAKESTDMALIAELEAANGGDFRTHGKTSQRIRPIVKPVHPLPPELTREYRMTILSALSRKCSAAA